jgi:hypothetical protein
MHASTHVREVKFVTNDEERVDEVRAILQEMARTEIGGAVGDGPPSRSLWSDACRLHFECREGGMVGIRDDVGR